MDLAQKTVQNTLFLYIFGEILKKIVFGVYCAMDRVHVQGARPVHGPCTGAWRTRKRAGPRGARARCHVSMVLAGQVCAVWIRNPLMGLDRDCECYVGLLEHVKHSFSTIN